MSRFISIPFQWHIQNAWQVARIASIALLIAGWVSTAQALPFAEARHLLARTGFGQPTPQDITALMPLSRDQAIDSLIAAVHTTPQTPWPHWLDTPLPSLQARRDMTPKDKKAFQARLRAQGQDAKLWWIQEMVRTPSPLTEKLVLMWHGHFTSSLKKVKFPHAMLRQNHLFRTMALGNFSDLLQAITRDPAMLMYLDGAKNKSKAPNENYARELLELFTLGEGQYTENDIKNVARALTGLSIDPNTGQFMMRRRIHDHGQKTIFQQTGSFHDTDVIALLAKHPALPTHIATLYWRTFISTTPDPAEIARLSQNFAQSGLNLKTLLRDTLSSPAFWDAENRGNMIKSPVDIVIGTLRLWPAVLRKMPETQISRLPRILQGLGQDLLDPPNVKGWKAGESWITSNTLMQRQMFLQRISRGMELAITPLGTQADNHMPRTMAMHPTPIPMDARPDVRAVAALLLPIAPVDVTITARTPMRDLLLDPAFQLK
jgi:uncharacterized protein (DUF1800 family)